MAISENRVIVQPRISSSAHNPKHEIEISSSSARQKKSIDAPHDTLLIYLVFAILDLAHTLNLFATLVALIRLGIAVGKRLDARAATTAVTAAVEEARACESAVLGHNE